MKGPLHPCTHLVLLRHSLLHLLIHSTPSNSSHARHSARKGRRATDTLHRRLYEGQQKPKGRFILGYALGGSRDGKAFRGNGVSAGPRRMSRKEVRGQRKGRAAASWMGTARTEERGQNTDLSSCCPGLVFWSGKAG